VAERLGSAPEEPLIAGLFSTRWAVAGAAATTLLWRRDTATVLCLSGAVLNGLLSKVLKRVINEARPAGARLRDPGMPSSHAQSLFFFAAYISVALALAETGLPALWAALIFSSAAAAAGWRVYSGLHSLQQVGVGALIGSLFGAAWRAIVQPQVASAVATGPTAVAVLLVAAALVVFGFERWLGAALKRRR